MQTGTQVHFLMPYKTNKAKRGAETGRGIALQETGWKSEAAKNATQHRGREESQLFGRVD